MKEKIFKKSPDWIQNMLISIFNLLEYKKRYGGKYKYYYNLFVTNSTLSLKELLDIQEKRYRLFVSNAVKNSSFYSNLYSKVQSPENISEITNLPIVDKEMLRTNLGAIYTISKEEGIKSKTGGTTGKSLEVLFAHNDMQERFAMLDAFRSRFGYKLGKKTAWFSGKDLLTDKNIKKNIFWKTDYLHHVRYYSTFHIKDEYLKHYVENLIEFKPEYIIGFPSSILEIAKYGVRNNYDFPTGTVKAIFPTAETITSEMRLYIEKFFKATMYNQYASSEGAPFIFECEKRNLHLELQSGVFEVLDNDGNPASKGSLVTTSFTTSGTPLIRYGIEDQIELMEGECSCGNKNPLVKEIMGRENDYIFSPKNGKINLGNVSNTLKDIKGIVKFQAIQNELDSLQVNVIVDEQEYNPVMENKFLSNWRDRVGDEMNIDIKIVKTIDVEKSGKFRLIKNNIKHLINN